MDWKAVLEHSYECVCLFDCEERRRLSRLEYLSDYVFDFTTCDTAKGEMFARRAVEVCRAISDRKTFEYIEDDERYTWYLIMCNMPFFADNIDWGTSVRGAFWSSGPRSLDTSGVFIEGEQETRIDFCAAEWQEFIRAVVAFSEDKRASLSGV